MGFLGLMMIIVGGLHWLGAYNHVKNNGEFIRKYVDKMTLQFSDKEKIIFRDFRGFLFQCKLFRAVFLIGWIIFFVSPFIGS